MIKSLTAAARGYTFQDVIGGICILSVLFKQSKAVAVEDAFQTGDKFDDIILYQGNDQICLQVKNRPEQRLTTKDLRNASSDLNVDEFVDSADSRLTADEGTRFIVLTSHREEPGPGVEFVGDNDCLSFLEDFGFQTRKLADGEGEVTTGTDIEFVLGVPGIDTEDDEELAETIHDTELFRTVQKHVVPLLEEREHPEIRDPVSLVTDAVDLARWARNHDTIGCLTREEIVKRLDYVPSPQISQQFPVEEGYIQPQWIQGLEEIHPSSNRILVEGKPGSGKSTGMELLHRDWEEEAAKQTLRFFLYVPEDAGQVEKKRNDPDWFRHQLAAQLHDTFPEAFTEDVSLPIWTGTDALQSYIDRVAEWAEGEGKQLSIVIDGLDHALPSFGDTTHGDQIEDTILEEIASLIFPSPLTLLMVSRPLSPTVKEELSVGTEITVPQWNIDEIKIFLEQKGISTTDDLVSRLQNVSGGLPVILSHLLRKAEISNNNLEEGLLSALSEASEVDGELEEYYQTVWEPLRPHERDATTLVALNPTGLKTSVVDDLIDFPWIQKEVKLDETPLSHIIDRVDGDQLKVFHDSFRSHVLDQLDEEDIEAGHQRLFDYLVDRCSTFPDSLDSLSYHAEQGPGREALKDFISLDQVLEWWKRGVYVDRALEAIELGFDAALRDGDYMTAFEYTILGGVTRNMLDIYADDGDRLSFYTSQGDRAAAVALINQIRAYDGGTEDALTAMRTLARTWEDAVEREWMREWADAYQNTDRPSWDPEAYFELAAILLDPDEFWDQIDHIVRENSVNLFQEIFLSVGRYPKLLDHREQPPDWLVEDCQEALEACQEIERHLPDQWQDALHENAPPISEISVAGLHTLVECDGPQDDIIDRVDALTLETPDRSPSDSDSRFSNGYYIGATLASCGQSPAEVQSTVLRLASEQPQAHQLLALIGAATTRDTSANTGEWVDAVFHFLEKKYNDGTVLDQPIRPEDRWSYTKAVETAVKEFKKVMEVGSQGRVGQVQDRAEETRGETGRLLETVTRQLIGTYPDDKLPEALEEQYQEVLERPPEEEPPTRELVDLAIYGAEAGYDDLADHYFDTAIERCFRYGYRKDIFLDDIWKGFLDVVENDWDRHMGTAIQFLNWSRLLHELTDGKETRHFEGKYLTTLLDEDIIEFEPVLNGADHEATINKLRDWRLENPATMSRAELDRIVEAEITRLGAREFTDKKLPLFGKAAVIAADRDWDEVVVKSLTAMNHGDYVDEGVDADLARELHELAAKYDVSIPNDLQSDDDDSSDLDESTDEEIPSENEELHQILADHSDDDPLTEQDIRDLTTEEIHTAGKLVQSRSYRYDPPAAVPLARVLADRESPEEGIELLTKVMAERDLISWWIGGPGFEPLAETLLDLSEDDALQAVLTAWRKSSTIDTAGYQTVFPQLMWIVKRSEGQIAAEELLSHTMEWLRRLFWPYEDRIQIWGKLDRNSSR